MNRIWTSNTARAAALTLISLCASLFLGGCATRKEKLLPHGDATMLDVWNANTGGSAGGSLPSRALLDARESLRRPLTPMDRAETENAAYTRDAKNEINSLFGRLPDPDLVMYVFPHLSGEKPVPIPGYSTVFSFYEHVQYALPGERTQNY